MARTSAISSTCGVALLAAGAHADFVGISFAYANADIEAIPNQSVPDGYNVWRVYADFDDPLDAFLNITVDWSFSATFYQSPFGGDGPPNPLLFDIPGLENLAADTFVTHGVSQLPIDNLGFDPEFEMLPNCIHGGWFDSNPITPTLPDANGQILIAQLTLPEKATGGGYGTIFYEDAQNPGTATPGEFIIDGDGGPCIPGPGAGVMLVLALAIRPRSGRKLS